MSIAYGFEPDVSPIYEDDDDRHPDTRHSVHFSSADTPRRYGRAHERTLGTTHIYAETSSQFHEFHQECAPEDVSEVAESNFTLITNPESDEVVADSKEGVEYEDEVVPDSTGFLDNTFIVVSAGCCPPIQHFFSKSLSEMGASVQKSVNSRTTHLVVDRYADEKIVGEAMARRPAPPLIVDVKWIQECMDRRQRCAETDYSMRGCRFLKQTFRRLSSFREPTPEAEEDRTWWMDMENDAPEEPAQLLDQIRKLSERLDALMNYEPMIRFEYHSPECPTRQRPSPFQPSQPRIAENPESVHLRNLLESISTSSTIRRRRSFTGFHLEHREPHNDVIELQKANKDTRDTWQQPAKTKKKARKPAAPVKTINDMRKTMAADLTTIRETYQKNADLNRARTPKKATKTAKKKAKPVPVRADDSDIQSALASLTISTPPATQNPQPIETSIRRREPLVVTKSNFLNRLQMREVDDADDDFISDVSGMHRILNENQNQRKRNGVVFSGFSKDSSIEKKLRSICRRFRLDISAEIDENTQCLVSRHGKRTLLVLKAICSPNVLIVRPQWLEESAEDSRLLPPEDYVFDEWHRIFGKTGKIFENFPKIWISTECQPSGDDLVEMVTKCGGKTTRKLRRAKIAIAPENWEIPDEMPPEIDICTPLLIIDSISSAECQNPRDYLINC